MIPISGTLESTGPNKSGQTDAPMRELNYNSITDNASTSPGTQMLDKGGPNKHNDSSSPLSNEVIQTNDTAVMGFPAGTVTGGGPNA